MNEKGLQTLPKRALIHLTKVSLLMLWLFGEQQRLSFQKVSEKKSGILDLVYFELCGPIEVNLLEANATLFLLLMMHLGKCGLIFHIRKVKSSSYSMVTCHGWNGDIKIYRLYLDIGESTLQMNLRITVQSVWTGARRQFLALRSTLV